MKTAEAVADIYNMVKRRNKKNVTIHMFCANIIVFEIK